jgi:two-component sensor histidine kinase
LLILTLNNHLFNQNNHYYIKLLQMMRKKILLFLLIVTTFAAYSQPNEYPSKTIYRDAKRAKPDALQVRALLNLAEYHLSHSNRIAMPKSLDSAFYFAQKAEKISLAINYKTGLGQSYITLSKIYQNKAQAKPAILHAEKAIAIFKNTGQKTELGDAYMALYHSDTGDRDPNESLALAKQAEEFYKKSGSPLKRALAVAEQGQCTAILGKINDGIALYKKSIALNEAAGKKDNQLLYSWVCIFYDAQGQYKPALENILKALALVEQYNDTSPDAVQVYFYAWAVYGHLNDKTKEIFYLKKAQALNKIYNNYDTTIEIEYYLFRFYQDSQNTDGMNSIIKDLEKTYAKLSPRSKINYISNLIKAYTALKDFKKADVYAKIGMKFSAEMPLDDDRQEAIYKGLVGYLFKSGQYELSRKYANAYLKYNEKFKNPLIDIDMNLFLVQIDSAQGNYKGSLENYRKVMQLKNSLLDSDKNKQIAELEIKYETDKKDKDLQLLKKQGELQKTRLEKSNLLRNIALGSLAVFLVLIILLFLRYREKQKMNNILGLQKTEINDKNNALQKAVTEKEWLLKEIHHRAKNNLHMVMNLLNTQSHYLKDGAAVEAIEESKNRIFAMSLIHKKLYQTDEVQCINMEAYICELIQNFKDSYVTGKKIKFIQKIEPLQLAASEAVPLGLIINEAITNAIKHAFVDNEGEITVLLKRENDNRIILLVQDNGTGIDKEMMKESYNSMGMKLIKGLSEDLSANLQIYNDKGLHIWLEFTSSTSILENIVVQE